MPTALISVSNKEEIVSLAKALADMNWRLICSKGTAAYLRERNLPVQEIEAYTGSPELLDGLVKTLHPAVYAGILATAKPEHLSDMARVEADLIDLVVIDLHPFESVIEEAQVDHQRVIKNIDVGGVELIRAAAKNYERVTVLVDPSDQDAVIKDLSEDGKCGDSLRIKLAIKAFRHVAAYDAMIADYLESTAS
ncbi:MAG: hypothetical protein JW750_02585 [Anaerolineaceae bacterium]|nr:hypothetical protein [Anaerolineaceae bacterium]